MILVQPEAEQQMENEVESDENENEVSSGDEANSSGDESNKESDAESDSSTQNVDANAGWADSVAKILRTNKPKGKKTLVLSKAKKLTDIRREKPKEVGFQIEGEVKEEKPDPLELLDRVKEEGEPARKKKKEIPKVRVKPNILDKDRERTLSKIATRGVVQLFNAVRNQQKDIEGKLEEAGPLERNKEKVLKSLDKRQFLNVLMGESAKSQAVDKEVKSESENEDLPKKTSKKTNSADSTWTVLRDDFMMGAKFKDWDKNLEEEVEEEDE